MPSLRKLLAASAAAATLTLPALAHATATFRVEFIRAASSDLTRGATANQIGESDGVSEVLTVTGTGSPVTSLVAPPFGPVSGGFARVSVIAGAVDVWRASGTQASAVRVAAGDAPTLVAIGTGDTLQFVEDPNPPTAVSGGGGGGAISIAIGQVVAGAYADGAIVSLGNTNDAILANCASAYNGTQAASLICLAAKLIDSVQHGSISPGSNDIGKTEGAETQGSPVSGGMVRNGCRAALAAPTVVSDGAAVDRMCSGDGKTITKPFSPSNLDQAGASSAINSNTAFTTLSGWTTPTAGQYAIVTGYHCSRTDAGTTNAWLIFNNGSSSGLSIVPLPPSGGANVSLETPWRVYAAATVPAFETSASGVTAVCSVEGFNGN